MGYSASIRKAYGRWLPMNSFSSVQAEEALRQSRPPAMGHRDAHECASALAAGDLASCYQAYSAAPTWEDRWFCLEHVARHNEEQSGHPIDESLIDAWVGGWPDHPVPLLVRAATNAFNGRDASADLGMVHAIEPHNPLVHGLEIVNRASSGVGDLEGPLGAMLAIEPLYEPHVHFLRALGPNGGGDLDTALTFATSVNGVVPAGSPLRAVVPLTAIETVLADQPEDHLAFLESLGLRSLIMMAAGQSVFHPDFIGPYTVPGVKAMTAFAVALVLIGEDDLALMLHRRLDGVFADWPFSLLAPPSMASWVEIGRHMAQNAPTAAAAGDRI